jgi:membrane-associated phospholipid phosphatase
MRIVSIYKLIVFLILLHINETFYLRTTVNVNSTRWEKLESDNGDEKLYKSYHFGNFQKTLPRDKKGLVNTEVYTEFVNKILSKDFKEFSQLPQSTGSTIKPVGILEANSFDQSGPAYDALAIPTPYAIASKEYLAELLEIYAMGIACDTPFNQFKHSDLIAKLSKSLNKLSCYHGSKEPNKLFRGSSKGDQVGPYVSQFLYKDVNDTPYIHQQKIKCYQAGHDFGVTLEEYLNIQNGIINGKLKVNAEATYIRTGRDLATWVHRDVYTISVRNTALILFNKYSAALNPTILKDTTLTPITLFNLQHILCLIEKASTLALNATFYHKWYVHRYLRPEEGGFVLDKYRDTILNKELDVNDFILKTVFDTQGNYLLSSTYPEMAPAHPSYPSGHATIAGAGVTILKAFFNNDFVITDPVVPSENGLNLASYNGKDVLTIGGELDKLASNIGYGRNFARIHYRDDAEGGILMGEKVAIKVLEEFVYQMELKEIKVRFSLRKRNGELVNI